MAGLRRPTSLTGVLSDVKLNIETLQARGTTTGSSVSSITPSGNDDAGSAPGISSPTPLYLYKRVIKAFIYGSKVTGNTPRMELYFGEDPKIAQGAFVQIQGINGTSTDTWEEMSPAKYAVYAVDTPPWNDGARANQDWRDTPDTGNNGQTVTHTIWFNPDIEVPITYSTTSGRELITTRRIDSVSATGSTVTVNFNSTHVFREGDVISVDLEGALYGRDGLFKVSNVVDSNTIEYELETPLTSPISLSGSGLGTKYVYPVAHEYVEDGTIWNDTSVSPAKVYVWKEYRWYDTADPIGEVAIEQDGIAPSPVTDLDVTSSLPTGSTSPVLSLTWTPPTTRSNGAPITGFLDGYDIWYKRSTETVWKKEFVKDGGQAIAAHEIKDAILLQNFTYNIRVYAVDIMGQYSTVATDSVLTAKYAETLNAPSTPTATSKLGTITVNWDGLDSSGNLPVPGVLYIEFHESTTSGFTPSESTLVESVPITSGGNYVVLTERLFDGTTFYYYKTRFVRQISPTELITSSASTQSTGIKVTGVTGPDIVAGSITTNRLEAGFVTAELLRGNIIRAGAAGSNARVELKTSGIFAYNSAGDPVLSFDTSTSVLTIGGYAQTSQIPDVSGFITGSQVNSNVTSISGNAITTGTITGIVIRTAASGQRIQLESSTADFYDGSGYVGNIYGGTARGSRGIILSGNIVVPGFFTAGTIESSSGSFGSGSMGTQLIVDSIRRQSNGALTFTTSAGTTVAYIDTSNSTTTTFDTFWITGRVSAGGAYFVRSSRRFKTNIQNYTKNLNSILDLNLVTYQVDPNTYTDFAEGDGPAPLSETEIGLIAEEVAELGLDGMVVYDPRNPNLPYGVDYSKIGLFLVPVVRELKKELNDLKDRIDNL